MSPVRIGEPFVKEVLCGAEKEKKHDRYIELSEYGGGGRRSFVVISEGSDGKGWMDCWVQL